MSIVYDFKAIKAQLDKLNEPAPEAGAMTDWASYYRAAMEAMKMLPPIDSEALTTLLRKPGPIIYRMSPSEHEHEQHVTLAGYYNWLHDPS